MTGKLMTQDKNSFNLRVDNCDLCTDFIHNSFNPRLLFFNKL